MYEQLRRSSEWPWAKASEQLDSVPASSEGIAKALILRVQESRFLRLSPKPAHQLQHFRRRTWALIALCFVARGADAAVGLNLIEHTETVAAQEVQACPVSKEPLT